MPDTVPFTTIAETNPSVAGVPQPGTLVSFIPMADVSDTGEWRNRQTRDVSRVSTGFTVFQENDVLFAKITPCMENGKGCHARGLRNGIGFGSTEFIILRAKGQNDTRFIFHWTRNRAMRKAAEMSMTGSAGQQRVQPSFFARFNVPAVPPPEQTAIAGILDTVDEAIRHTAAVIEKLKKIKAGLLHDLLTRGIDENGQLRDPVRHTEQFKDSPLGKVPKAWEVKPLGELCCHVGSGVTPTGGHKIYGQTGILFIRSQNVTFDGLLLDDVAFINPSIHEGMRRSEIFPHDVLLNITGASIGRCCPVPANLGTANVNQHVCSIRIAPKPTDVDAAFISAFLGSGFGQRQIDRLNAGSNRQGLNYSQIRSFSVPWPNAEERRRLAGVLCAHDDRAQAEAATLRKLTLMKQGLMQDLLTGRVRVPMKETRQ